MLALAGLVLLFIAYLLKETQRQLYRTPAYATGRVTGLVGGKGADLLITFSPRVVFVDSTGKTITFVNAPSSRPSRYQVGDTVKVVYSPYAPEDAEIDSFFTRWGGVLIAAALGFVFGGFGISAILPRLR